MLAKLTLGVGLGFLWFGLSASSVAGQTASTTRDGVYTAAQAQQGKILYGKQCASCHADSLDGVGQNPPLAGDDFLNNWQDQTLADLDTKIRTTMPATKPGSLTPEETAQLLAYMLSANKFPTGKTELPADAGQLKAIQIEPLPAKP